MLRAVVREFGAPAQVIALEDVQRVAPGPGMVEMRVLRAAINPSDLIPVTGAYPSRTALPFVPGFEGVGVVTRIGAGVTAASPGDRMLPIGASGLWQEFIQRPEEWCFAVPDDLPDEMAATAYVNPLTAFRLVAALDAHFGGRTALRIAVTAAGSAIGGMLLALLARDGFRPVALVRSRASAGRLKAHFDGDILAQDDPAADRGTFDAVLDAVGGPAAEALLAGHVRPGGAFVQYGALSGVPVDARVIQARGDVAFSFLWLRNWVHAAPRSEIERALAASFDGLRAGHLRCEIDSMFGLRDLASALARQEAPGRRGKVLLAP